MDTRSCKTICLVHDLSFAGGSSLAAMLPVTAACGCRAIPVPTALLSTHTGFPSPAVLDTADFAVRAAAHFLSVGLTADTVYSGYLMNENGKTAVDAVRAVFPLAYRIHDPAFADRGRLYTGMTDRLIDCHRDLAAGARLILPNVSEALALCGHDPSARLDGGRLRELCRSLTHDFAPAVITGVELDGGHFNVVADESGVSRIPYRAVPGSYPGTGDVFGAIVAALITRGAGLTAAVQRTAAIMTETVAGTNALGQPAPGGIAVEIAVRLAERSIYEAE